MATTTTPSTPAPVRSTPGPASRTPMHLGLAGCAAAAARRAVPSLSIRTADGSRVSILNDNDEADGADHKRCSSVPGLSSPGSSPASASPFRARSTPGAATPQQIPAMLPSLSTLVQAVRMVAGSAPNAGSAPLRRSISTSSNVSARHAYLPSSAASTASSSSSNSGGPCAPPSQSPGPAAPLASPAPFAAPAGTKSTGKRKYRCAFDGCGKAFTTSGHLARHQRIHTGEKNFSCLFPGCASRFSRQDNMMQHYRTHLSSKSRRNASPRKVVFVDQPGSEAYRPMFGGGPPQVFAGSHPIQHQHQHHPYAAPPPPAVARAPPMRMFAGAAPAHHDYHRGALAKHSPAAAHPGAMAFY